MWRLTRQAGPQPRPTKVRQYRRTGHARGKRRNDIMPAEIADITIDGTSKPMMAYQGEMPWHKLGTAMTGKPDVHAALKAANLDWEVTLKTMFYRHGDKA